MNNETFGITFQYAICKTFNLENNIKIERTDSNLLNKFIESKIIKQIYRGNKPVEYLSNSNKYTSEFVKRCPHNFLLENEQTFSVRTFKGNGKMFAPKVVGQAGNETFNHFFGHLSENEVTKTNFKEFCLSRIDEMLPIIVDYALVSDLNCWFYFQENNFTYEIIKRDSLPELTYDFKNFSFSKPTKSEWAESNTIKYKNKTILEIQLHTFKAA